MLASFVNVVSALPDDVASVHSLRASSVLQTLDKRPEREDDEETATCLLLVRSAS